MVNQVIFLSYAFINLAIAVILFYKLKQNFVSQFFIILVVYQIAFMGITSLINASGSQIVSPLLFNSLVFIYSMFPFIFLHFILIFIGDIKVAKSAFAVTAIYATGIFGFLMIQLGFLPDLFVTPVGLRTSSSIFYLTWMSILFAIGAAQLYAMYSGNNNKFKTKLLFSGFVFLMLVLPGPFSETLLSSFLSNYSQFYFLLSTLALIIAVYILFKQKSADEIMNALKRSINFLKNIMIKTDIYFNIELVEGDVSNLLKIQPNELINKNLSEFLLDAGYLNKYRNLSLNEKLSEGLFEAKFSNYNSNELFMSFSIAPVFDNENISGYILIGHDITGRKNMEQELRNNNESLEQNIRIQTSELAEMNRRLQLDIEERKHTELKLRELTNELKEAILSKDKMFSIVAHDLRSPFVTLLGFSELLVQEIDDLGKNEAKQFSQNIYISAKRVYHLLENLLQWSKIQTDRIQFNPGKINLNKLVEDIFVLFEGNTKIKSIRLTGKVKERSFVYADKNMLETIIRNLVSNAIKFTKSGGSVSIANKKFVNFMEISIADTGIGIPEENISRVFAIDNFVSTLDTENRKGSGLGLILAKEFVEKNGGKLHIESEVNKGTTVKFTMPLVVEKS